MTVAVTLEAVSCVFGSGAQTVRAVEHVDLTIEGGEFFTLLGPSGSGKTTCLRMIGGFTLPTSGRILIGGQDVSQLPPYARPVNTVFQDYALFPHMNVLENVSYGLLVNGARKASAEAEAAAVSRAERTRHFADGTLSIDDLNYNEIKEHLVRLCVPGKERIGKKEELRARLKVAYSTGKRKAVDDEIGAQQASAEKKAKRHL